jgi:tetratricopeptide (TPR) repeat protein
MRIVYTFYFLCLGATLSGESPTFTAVADSAERLQQEGKLPEAENVLLAAVGEKARFRPSEKAFLYDLLGSVYQDQRRYIQSERAYRRSIAEWERSQGQAGLGRTLHNLASLLWETGKLREAERTLRRSYDLRLKSADRQDPLVATTLVNLALLHFKLQRWAEAQDEFELALQVMDGLRPAPNEIPVASHYLAIIYRRAGREREAAALFQKALSILEPRLAEGQLTLDQLAGLALTYYHTGQHEKAETLFKKSVAAAEKHFGPDHAMTARFLSPYVVFLSQTNRKAEARELETRAKRIRNGDKELLLARQTISLFDMQDTKGKAVGKSRFDR